MDNVNIPMKARENSLVGLELEVRGQLRYLLVYCSTTNLKYRITKRQQQTNNRN